MKRRLTNIGAIAILAGLGIVGIACGRSELGPTVRDTLDHDGMIQGSVWVADEGGNSITVIDAEQAA